MPVWFVLSSWVGLIVVWYLDRTKKRNQFKKMEELVGKWREKYHVKDLELWEFQGGEHRKIQKL